MSRRLQLLASACLAMALLLAAQLAKASSESATAALARRAARAEAIQAQLDELALLRSQVASVEASERPQQDLIARVQSSLASSGIPSAALQNLVSEGDRALGTRTGYRQQSIQLSLAQLPPRSLGQFIANWRNTQPTWAIDRIELSHAEGDASLYDVRLVLAATYLAPSAR